MESSEVKEVLERAADLMEQYAFVQRQLYAIKPGTDDEVTACCADGALLLAGGCKAGTWDYEPLYPPSHYLAETAERGKLWDVAKTFGAFLIERHNATRYLITFDETDHNQPEYYATIIYRWNDANGRTKDEVVTALRECAAAL